MVDTYSNATLAGEVGELAVIDAPTDDYLRYYTGGYGMTQVHAHHKRFSLMHGALSEPEKIRVMASNLNGAERVGYSYIASGTSDFYTQVWAPFLEFYRARKNAYLNDSANFNPNVDWPPKWFRAVATLKVVPTSTSVTITWDTPGVDTDYTVSILNKCDGYKDWWRKEDNFLTLKDSSDVLETEPYPPEAYIQTESSPEGEGLQTHHSLQLNGLLPDKTYKLRIRSSNRKPGSAEIIFGYAGEFQTQS